MSGIQGIYKYEYNGEIIYVGKANSSIKGRVDSHKKELKFKKYLSKCKIYYFECTSWSDNRLYESYLIEKYNCNKNAS